MNIARDLVMFEFLIRNRAELLEMSICTFFVFLEFSKVCGILVAYDI